MKKLAWILAACLLIGALSACGAAETKTEKPAEPAPSAAPTAAAETAKPSETTPAPETPTPSETPADAAPTTEPPETEAPETEAPVNEKLETAKTFIDKTTTELFAAIGMPPESDYAPSCLGPGEDGNLYYEGFTVYTYRENGVETIRIVE